MCGVDADALAPYAEVFTDCSNNSILLNPHSIRVAVTRDEILQIALILAAIAIIVFGGLSGTNELLYATIAASSVISAAVALPVAARTVQRLRRGRA